MSDSTGASPFAASVIIPAHNERWVIRRLLTQLVPDRELDPRLEVIVVPNGCTDDTAAVAASVPGVRVVETDVPSKRAALRLGDQHATAFPRCYVDADVETGRDDILRLAAALAEPGVHAAAPRRLLDRDRASLPVRWYFDVWEQLPAVRAGVFGRGVVAVSAEGFERISALPPLMSDDLAMSSAFDDAERRIVADATVIVHPSRTWGDLMRRRVRVATGTAQAYGGDVPLKADSRTSGADLLRLAQQHPALAPKLPVFAAAAVLARRRAAAAIDAGDFDTWARDESSRD